MAENDTRPGKVMCIGRNYARHAKEMKADLPTVPMVFLKPSTSIISTGSSIELPSMTSDVHHEVELVVRIGKRGKHIPEHEAMSYVGGYACGLDMTARDLQAAAKAAGAPWSVAKGFDTFAPVGPFSPADAIDPDDAYLTLEVNNHVVQKGWTGDMIFPVVQLISYCSRIFTLEVGDLLFTGTPEGVGPVREGDHLRASIQGLADLDVSVSSESSIQ